MLSCGVLKALRKSPIYSKLSLRFSPLMQVRLPFFIVVKFSGGGGGGSFTGGKQRGGAAGGGGASGARNQRHQPY